MAERDWTIYRRGHGIIEKSKKAGEFLMEAMGSACRGTNACHAHSTDPAACIRSSTGCPCIASMIIVMGRRESSNASKAWESLTEAMQRQPVEERTHTAGSVEGAWEAVMDRYQRER